MEAGKVYIKVFITKSYKFRVDIKEVDRLLNESLSSVTVGSESWKNGKGRSYEDLILTKCQGIIDTLKINLANSKQ